MEWPNPSRADLIVALAAMFAALGLPSPASADGFVEPKGFVWTEIGYRIWSADETFAGPNARDLSGGVELGDRVPFDSTTGGRMRMQALEAQLVAVPWSRIRLGLYMPLLQQVRFQNTNFETTTTGTGDIRPSVGYQVTPEGLDAATTLHLRAKIPTTTRSLDAASVPLSEGQFDLAIDQTTSWAPVDRLHLTLRTMFRYRAPGKLPTSGERYKPGDETVVEARIGGRPVRTLWLEAGYRGLWSTGWEQRASGTAGRTEFRMVQEVTGSIYWNWGNLIGGAVDGGALDLSVAWPWTGRDYPAGPTFAAALAWDFS